MSQVEEDRALILNELASGEWRYAGEARETLGLTKARWGIAMRGLADAGLVQRQGATVSTSYPRLRQRQTREAIATRADKLEARAPSTNGFGKMPRLGTIVTGLRWDPEKGEYYISFDSGEEVMCSPK